MAQFKLDIQVDIHEIVALQREGPQAIQEALDETNDELLYMAYDKAPVGDDDSRGDFRSRLTKWRVDRNTVAIGTRPGLPKDWAIELGSGPHPITGNPLLKFWWKKENKFFIGHAVMHPGTPAQHVLGKTMVHAPRIFQRILGRKLARLKAKRASTPRRV